MGRIKMLLAPLVLSPLPHCGKVNSPSREQPCLHLQKGRYSGRALLERDTFASLCACARAHYTARQAFLPRAINETRAIGLGSRAQWPRRRTLASQTRPELVGANAVTTTNAKAARQGQSTFTSGALLLVAFTSTPKLPSSRRSRRKFATSK